MKGKALMLFPFFVPEYVKNKMSTTSYYLYQKYQQIGTGTPTPVYPEEYSYNGDGTMTPVVKSTQDPSCGYYEPQYRWVVSGYECVSGDTPSTGYSRQYLTTVVESSEGNNMYFTFSISTSVTTGTVASVSYSLDNGSTWTTTYNTNGRGSTLAINTPMLSVGDRVLWKGEGINYRNCYLIGNNQKFSLEGNIMSLLYGDNFVGETDLTNHREAFMGLFSVAEDKLINAEHLVLPATTLGYYCYYSMFANCSGLTKAPELPATIMDECCYTNMFRGCSSLTVAPALPATILGEFCYMYMFHGCTSLTTAPSLPATTMEEACYEGMFNGCTSLTTAPVLSATTLAGSCYEDMFRGCTSLITSPALPATTLAGRCYLGMFYGCTSLTTAPYLRATTLAGDCYNSMFRGCTSLTTAPELPATTLAVGCYEGMFYGCTSLTTAPVLSASTLVSYCYRAMFKGCTSLNYIKCLATVNPSNISYPTDDWVYNVSYTGTFVKDASSSIWSRGSSGIPTGWTVQDAS